MPATESLPRDRAEPHALALAVVRDSGLFGALRADWADVLQHSTANNPFLTWEWLHAWWTHLRGSRTLELVTVRDDHQLIAIAPLCARRGRLPWLGHLEFLGTGWAGSDYLDVIVRSGHEAECVDELANTLRARGQTIRFDHVPGGGVATMLSHRLRTAGWSRESARAGVCPFASLRERS